jgi:tRNA (guanine-N7-)-methyltransferase
MTRTKLKRIKKANELPNVFKIGTVSKENVLGDFFKSTGPITLEIGCGHGDYSVELGKRFPDRNFIGMDIKGARIYNGAMNAIDKKLNNVAFIIGRAEKLREVFGTNTLEEIYIPFPDPHVRRTSERRRLISPGFLKLYKELLVDDGTVHFKSDNEGLFDYALKVISEFGCRILFQTKDLYESKKEEDRSEIKTKYEEHYIRMKRKICYVRFKF